MEIEMFGVFIKEYQRYQYIFYIAIFYFFIAAVINYLQIPIDPNVQIFVVALILIFTLIMPVNNILEIFEGDFKSYLLFPQTWKRYLFKRNLIIFIFLLITFWLISLIITIAHKLSYNQLFSHFLSMISFTLIFLSVGNILSVKFPKSAITATFAIKNILLMIIVMILNVIISLPILLFSSYKIIGAIVPVLVVLTIYAFSLIWSAKFIENNYQQILERINE